MATDLTPVRSDFEVEDDLLHGADVEYDACISSDDESISALKEMLNIPEKQPIYGLRKRTDQKTTLTFIDQDKSGNFDPEEEERRVKAEAKARAKKSRQCLSRFRKIRNATKNETKSQSKQQNTTLSARKRSIPKAPIVKASKRTNGKSARPARPAKSAKLARPANPLRPEDYLTKEDFEYLDDLEEPRTQPESRSPSPDVLEDSAGHKGVVTKIKTSFTHPIEFGFDYPTTDCNFCELPTYGFIGSFEKEPYCICWDDGLGFTQLTGGDTETTTTMCQSCTMDRVQIACCNNHEIRAINPNTLDFAEALEDLLAQAEPRLVKEQLLRWCSLCFSPAQYACFRRQDSVLTDDGEVEGCGLKLCAVCETKLREVFGGDMQAMVAVLDSETKVKEDDDDLHGKVRADIGLLCGNGILMMNVANVAAESADEEESG